MGKIKILILEDTPEIPGDGYEYIDKIKETYENNKQEATIIAITKNSDYQKIDSIMEDKFDIAILDYVLELFGPDSNGWIHIEKLIEKNPYCNIVLVTALNRIQEDIESLSEKMKQLIDKKMNIKYIPKDRYFTNSIERYVEEVIGNLKSRWQLQDKIIKCAIAACKALRDTSIGELIEKIDTKRIPGKKDTYFMDVKTEEHIRKMFVPLIHEHKIVICTEEGGVQNKVIYRVDRPVFYIFSDPFDGSSAMKDWIDCLITENSSIMTSKLKDIILNEDYMKIWEGNYGPKELNSPMISIVLTERYHVIGNVLINLFTGDLYFSNDMGNYRSNITSYNETNPDSYRQLEFRTYKGIEENRLFLCTLQYKKYNKYEEEKEGKPQDFQFLMHFMECIKPHIPADYDLKQSFKKRKQRNDFTPGPGRILFLTTIAEECSTGKEDEQKELYSCILSSGEPLTEWAGWFAFLRHSNRKFRAYCLRTGSGNICQHQIQRDNIKGTMLPTEVGSLFKSGMMDFEVLHTGYRGAMHNYTDSIVVFFDEDESWKRIIERKLEDRMTESFVRIEP